LSREFELVAGAIDPWNFNTNYIYSTQKDSKQFIEPQQSLGNFIQTIYIVQRYNEGYEG